MPRPRKEKPNHGNLYEVKITVGKRMDGTLIRKSFYSPTSKADARKQAEQYKIEKAVSEQTGQVFVEKSVTFADWAVKWLETYKKGKVKQNTYVGTYYDIVHKHLVPYFGQYVLTDIRPVDVQAFFDKQSSKYALETIKKMRTSLRAIFNAAIENDLCYKNPVTNSLTITSEREEVKKQTYSQADYEKVWKFAETHKAGTCIMVLLETGISRSELLGIRWENIDFANQVLYIEQGTVDVRDPEQKTYKTVSAGLKNEYRRRAIPISKELCERLQKLPRNVQYGGNKKKGTPPKEIQTDFVFHSPEGKAYSPKNWMNRVYKPFMEDMHRENPKVAMLNPHELRHTRATLWKDAGVDLFSIAKLLGHSDLDMLAKRYAHNNIETLKKALGME